MVARYVFGQPTVWAHDYTKRIFGAYFILIGAYTLVLCERVRADILPPPEPSRPNDFPDPLNFVFLIHWVTLQGVNEAVNALLTLISPQTLQDRAARDDA